MSRKLTYEEKLRRAESRELKRIKRQQVTEDRKREREIRQQERRVNVSIRKHEVEIQHEALKRQRRKNVGRRKTKRMLKKVWRKLI